MKPLTQKEIIELVKAKKLPPSVLKPYQEEEDKPILKESSGDDKLIEAIYMLVAAISKNDNGKAILEAIKNQPIPEVKVENILPPQKEKEPLKWEFEIVRDDNDKMRKVIAEAKG